MVPARRLLATLALIPLLLAACGSSGSSAGGGRPRTDAKLQIVNPTANEVTGPNLTIKLALTGARVVPATTVKGKLPKGEGHIHVSVDNKLVSMAYGTTQDLNGLAPGAHAKLAEFVAIDHQPFANRVVATVIFRVQ